jgi:hypothetical protein
MYARTPGMGTLALARSPLIEVGLHDTTVNSFDMNTYIHPNLPMPCSPGLLL